MITLEEEFRFEIFVNEADKINCIKVVIEHITSHPQANIALD